MASGKRESILSKRSATATTTPIQGNAMLLISTTMVPTNAPNAVAHPCLRSPSHSRIRTSPRNIWMPKHTKNRKCQRTSPFGCQSPLSEHRRGRRLPRRSRGRGGADPPGSSASPIEGLASVWLLFGASVDRSSGLHPSTWARDADEWDTARWRRFASAHPRSRHGPTVRVRSSTNCIIDPTIG